MRKVDRLKQENRSLKETCEILSDSKAINDIKKSLKEVHKGEYSKEQVQKYFKQKDKKEVKEHVDKSLQCLKDKKVYDL
jgi:hypothetical protein